MVGFPPWLGSNWFNLVQTLGVVGTLLFAGIGLHREAKAKEVENVLKLAERHRDLWAGFKGNKELERIFKTDLDLAQNPPTIAESEFLNIVIVHFQTGWWVAGSGGMTKLEEMKLDVSGFFSLPLPRDVWERTKKFRNRRFVRFVESALKLNVTAA